MTVRRKIVLTIFMTGALTALGVIATVLLAFQRFEHETAYYRANAFLGRVMARHDDLLDLRQRHPDEFDNFLRSLVLFEPDSQLYLLDADGTVLASTGEVKLPAGFKVALAPVMAAVGPTPMPYVMGDDPERNSTDAVIAAQPIRRTVIRNDRATAGYLYLVCQQRALPAGRLQVFRSAFAQPAFVVIVGVVALASLLAAWIIASVTRPLRRLGDAVAAVTRDGLDGAAAAVGNGAGGGDALAALPPATSNDEFAQLASGFRAMLAALRTQWAALRRLDHFRREGVSNLSHDLRSPLTATTACLETLDGRWAGDPVRDSDRALLQVALRNTRNAARMVRSLGDLAQLDEPTFRLRIEVLNVADLLDDIALRFAARAAQQGVVLTAPHGGDEALPAFAAVDIELFERAVANLVDNALKFCPAGAQVTLTAQRRGQQVHVDVADSGPGIAVADLPHLFDRFYQSRASVEPASAEGGKGLGLAIVKRIVELHGGEVGVRSEAGGGTCVTIVLPAAEV